MENRELENKIAELQGQINELEDVLSRTVRQAIFSYCFSLAIYKGAGFSLKDLPELEARCERIAFALEGAFFGDGALGAEKRKQYASLFQ